MSNNVWNMGVDLIPRGNNQHLGSKTGNKWTVNGYVLAEACEKSITDNAVSTAADSTDTNLITGRTLYYALQNAGVNAITDTQIDNLFA